VARPVGLDLIAATDGQDAQTYFLYDGLGSVTDLTDDEGDVVEAAGARLPVAQ
jgi:hypothetical protein